jgi:hypothetical protein
VPGLQINDFSHAKINLTVNELKMAEAAARLRPRRQKTRGQRQGTESPEMGIS